MAENPYPQVILITGTSSGIGRLAAETLARAGHSVSASMRDTAFRNREAAETLAKIPVRVIDLDVTQTESVSHAVQTVIQEAGRFFFCRTASVGVLGFEHGNRAEPIIALWNHVPQPRE